MDINGLVTKVNEIKAMVDGPEILSVDIDKWSETRIQLYGEGRALLDSLPGEIEHREHKGGTEVSKVVDGIRFFYLKKVETE